MARSMVNATLQPRQVVGNSSAWIKSVSSFSIFALVFYSYILYMYIHPPNEINHLLCNTRVKSRQMGLYGYIAPLILAVIGPLSLSPLIVCATFRHLLFSSSDFFNRRHSRPWILIFSFLSLSLFFTLFFFFFLLST